MLQKRPETPDGRSTLPSDRTLGGTIASMATCGSTQFVVFKHIFDLFATYAPYCCTYSSLPMRVRCLFGQVKDAASRAALSDAHSRSERMAEQRRRQQAERCDVVRLRYQ